MKGLFFHRWLMLPVLLLLTFQAVATVGTVLIVKSSDNIFFNNTIETLINQAQQPLKFRITTLDTLKRNSALTNDLALIVTLGIKAADYVTEQVEHTPVIHSYLTENQFHHHSSRRSNHYSILLDQPLHRYIRFIKLLTMAKKIGIIKNHADQVSPERLHQLETQLNIEIVQRLIEKGENPVTAVRDLLPSIDVLLSLPDPQIYNRHSLKGILLTSYRQSKPVVSYSPAQVKSGALAAIYSTPENI